MNTEAKWGPRMGMFEVRMEVGDLPTTQWIELDALVDSGASDTRVPRSILERLGIRPQERWPFRMADERQVEYDVGVAFVRIEGRAAPSTVVFGEEGSSPLLGATTLEMLRLGIDLVGQRLIPVPGVFMELRLWA
jgi:clan AA aspartic protease